MDSSGPWASYTYNGLPASQAPPPGSLASSSAGQRTVADLQAMGTPPAAAASQLLLAGMSPAAVAVAANSSFQLGNYDSSVFSQLFHHQKNAVAAQHRQHQAMSQGGQMPLEQSSPWTPQTNSLGNPFGVLPHQASSQKNNSPKGENTFSAHIIPPFAHSGSNYGNAAPAGPNLPFVPQKTAPKVPIFTPKAPPKHKAPPVSEQQPPAGRYSAPNNTAAAAAVAAASAVINNAKPSSNIIVHRSFPPHLQPHCRSYPSPDSDYQQQRNTPDSVSSATYGGDSDCHMSMERPSPNPSSPYYNMASPDSCVYSKPAHFQDVEPKRSQPQQQPQQQQQFPMKASHPSWEEKRAAAAAAAAIAGRYQYSSEGDNNNAFPVSEQQQHYQGHSTINLADLHGGGGTDELLGGSDSEDYERKRQRRNKRARKSDSPEKINRQLTLLQPVHAEDGYAAALSGFHSRVAFPPLPTHQPHQQQQVQHQHHHHSQQQAQQQHPHQQHPNNYQGVQQQQQQPQAKTPRDPSIDDELGFLESTNVSRSSQSNSQRMMLKKEGVGFMDSYIKFLNGDQEASSSNMISRTGHKSPPKQRARAAVQPPKPPGSSCQDPAAAAHLQQQQQHQHQQAYQIHQQHLDPAGHRDEAETSGRGRKRSLPQNEEQLEGLSITGYGDGYGGLDESDGSCSDNESSGSSEEIDYNQQQYQPIVVVSPMSPSTIRRYSQTDGESEEDSRLGAGHLVEEQQAVDQFESKEPMDADQKSVPAESTSSGAEDKSSVVVLAPKIGRLVSYSSDSDSQSACVAEQSPVKPEPQKLDCDTFQKLCKLKIKKIVKISNNIPNPNSPAASTISNSQRVCSLNLPAVGKLSSVDPAQRKVQIVAEAVSAGSLSMEDKAKEFRIEKVDASKAETKEHAVGSATELQEIGCVTTENVLSSADEDQKGSVPNLMKRRLYLEGAQVENSTGNGQDHLAVPASTSAEFPLDILELMNENDITIASPEKIDRSGPPNDPRPTDSQLQPTQAVDEIKTAGEASSTRPSLEDLPVITEELMVDTKVECRTDLQPGQQENIPMPKWSSGSIDDELLHIILDSGDPKPEEAKKVKKPLGRPRLASNMSNTENKNRPKPALKATPLSVKKKLFQSQNIEKISKRRSSSDSNHEDKRPKLSSNRKNASEVEEEPVAECDLIPKMSAFVVRKMYRTKTFVVHVTKKENGHPKMYRIDGPEFKQKFESFMEGGVLLYRSVSTYSHWALSDYREYRPVEVEFFKSTNYETVVRLLLPDTPKKCRKSEKTKFMIAVEDEIDDFRTYIQALLSQAVEPGFMQVVFEEKDEYFLTAVTKIDAINTKKLDKLQAVYQFPKRIIEMLNRWPKFIPLQLNVSNKCECCLTKNAFYLLEAFGNAYCKETLRPLESDSFAEKPKEFISCKQCYKNVLQYCNLAHLKFQCYQLCHAELNKLHQDDRVKNLVTLVHSPWFENLFKSLQELWAMADCLELRNEEAAA